MDWAAFWAATLAVFAVYFYTLGPSVGLEDSGELATAGAHLGVPHPPGYPFWTLCSWLFCKAFSWVTYMGHPTPAWAISCCSSLFGALAAGCTAMLICRSSRDFLGGARSSQPSDLAAGGSGADAWLSFAGGVGGALAFAFSPVEWSQSTIVEIYSLNTLFLMWMFLLSYNWMRRPTDKLLWFTAFVFGLGLTNYQVLLFAIVPLAIIICLKNFRMFRDFALYLMPVALTYQVLKIGDMPRASWQMSSDVIAKHVALIEHAACPSSFAVAVALAVFVATLVAVACLRSRFGSRFAFRVLFGGCAVAAAILLLAGAGFFAGPMDWAREAVAAESGARVWRADITAPLVDPRVYLFTAFFALASVAAAVYAALVREADDVTAAAKSRYVYSLVASGAFALAAVLVVLAAVPAPDIDGYLGEPYPWVTSEVTCFALLVALVATSLFVRRGLCYSIPVAGFHLVLFVLLERGAMNGLVHPASWWFWWPVAWNFIVLALAWLVLPNGRSVAGAALCAQLGVSFYVYMPIVSDLRNPPMNWGFPRTWDGFKHALTRGQYEAIEVPAFTGFDMFWRFLKEQMGHYFVDVKMQFSDFLVFFALAPFAFWRFFGNMKGRRRSYFALWFVGGGLALLILRAAMSAVGLDGRFWLFFDRVLLALLAVVSLLGAALIVFKQVFLRFAVSLRRFLEVSLRPGGDRVKFAAFVALVLDIIIVALYLWLKPGGKPGAFALCLAVIAVFVPLVASARNIARFFHASATRVAGAAFAARDVTQQWLLASGACFFVMSVPLIILAKTKGDLQDGFIQKVKFIMSHAMIALWIGYGLVLVGYLVLKLSERCPALRRRRSLLVAALAAAAIVGAGVVPVVQNYADDADTVRYGVSELVHKHGGSEQNGHTFGWQFGAYQLDGAKAIRQQIVADEEPLPDPDWPPPMEPYSIFFGGTDPGRFVPTYMIYSANYRPDIYLITQNALADETYMAVERDLYGDEIWIPASEDSGAAFNQYVEEVKSGKRQANGDLKIENGKVQVTGALGVMEINAILTQKMHEHDKARHAFYVEESYAIPWMYPYLSPHGLIMRLNADETPYDKATAVKDRDFWDWYVKRLLTDPMYKRDFAAQKSFCKLRSAIAGLYRTQGRRAEAAQAFREAHLLYPASPEATFRYVSEILIPAGRLSVVNDLMHRTDELDPFGGRTKRILDYTRLTRKVEELEDKIRDRTITLEEQYTLAESYNQLGHTTEAGRMMRFLLPALQKPDMLRGAADVLYAARRYPEAAEAYQKYMAVDKKGAADPDILACFAVAQHAAGRRAAAYQTFDKAAKLSAATAAAHIAAYLSTVDPASQDPTLWLRLAKLQYRVRQQGDALDSFVRAFNLNPELVSVESRRDRELYTLYGLVYEEQKRYRKALKERENR